MLDLKLKDKIPCAEIRKRTKIIDIIEYTLKQKWKWAGHIARLKDCSDKFLCSYIETEVADQAFYLTQSQYSDTGPTSPSTDPITPGA